MIVRVLLVDLVVDAVKAVGGSVDIIGVGVDLVLGGLFVGSSGSNDLEEVGNGLGDLLLSVEGVGDVGIIRSDVVDGAGWLGRLVGKDWNDVCVGSSIWNDSGWCGWSWVVVRE